MPTDDYREAMARHATGVAVLSTRTASGFRGLTVSAFASASLEPPLVLVCLERLAASRDAVQQAGQFSLSLLRRDQEFLAERFAARAPLVDAAWLEVPHRLGRNGLPVIEWAVAWLECELQAMLPAGDHDVALGRVLEAGWAGGEPLVLWDRSFWRLA